ncbi:MAG: MATE family efflux transporter [Legionellales bacterium]|nr:MATE family efflux transporter [Legionellales bacterium]
MQFNTKIPRMAFPLILSNISVPLLGLCNTFIVGHLPSSDYLAAIGLGAMIFNFLYWGLGFFRMSSTGLIAQFYGADNQQEINDTLTHSMGLALAIGLLLIILQYPLYQLTQLFIHATPNIQFILSQYYLIRIWGAPAVLISFVLVGTLLALQKSSATLLLLSFTNILAIVLSIVAVYVFHLNIKGLAVADIIAQYAGLVVGFVILSHYYDLKNIIKTTKFKLNKIKVLLYINSDIFIRTACIIIVFSFFTIWSSHISSLILAVNTLLMNFFQIIANALGGFDNVAEALAGEALGKKNSELMKKVIFDVGIWVLLFSLLLTIIYFIFGNSLINIMTNLTSVQVAAYQYMPYVALLPLIAFPSFLLDGIAIGANLFKEMRNSMIITLILSFIVWLALSKYGNVGLWISFYSFFIFRAIFLGYYIWKLYFKNCYD